MFVLRCFPYWFSDRVRLSCGYNQNFNETHPDFNVTKDEYQETNCIQIYRLGGRKYVDI